MPSAAYSCDARGPGAAAGFDEPDPRTLQATTPATTPSTTTTTAATTTRRRPNLARGADSMIVTPPDPLPVSPAIVARRPRRLDREPRGYRRPQPPGAGTLREPPPARSAGRHEAGRPAPMPAQPGRSTPDGRSRITPDEVFAYRARGLVR
ncbi:hypothetical protein GCM10020218_004010 [Dactylosporangium vinaceum]